MLVCHSYTPIPLTTGNRLVAPPAAEELHDSMRALRLYRKIIRTGFQWKDPTESKWILLEASKLFRENAGVRDKEKIDELILTGEERLAVAVWSNIPYARPVHMGGGGSEGLSSHKQNPIVAKGRKRVNASGKTVWKNAF